MNGPQTSGGNRIRACATYGLLAVGGLGLCLLVASVAVVALLPPVSTPVAQNGPTPGTDTPTARAPLPSAVTPRPATAVPAPSVATATTPQFVYNQSPVPSLGALVSTAPLMPADLSQATMDLTDGIAALNAAEWAFTQDAGKGAANLDADLRAVAAQALVTARLAQKIAATVQNDGGPQDMADEYKAVARLGYSVLIESQNVRTDLTAGRTTPSDGVKRIGALAAHLLTPRVFNLTNSENPFAANLPAGSLPAGRPLTQDVYDRLVAAVKAQSNLDVAPAQWLSASGQRTSVDVRVPVPNGPLNADLNAANLPNRLMTAEGQSNADLARQYASAQLNMLGATTKSARAAGLAAPEGDLIQSTFVDPLVQSWNKRDIQDIIHRVNTAIHDQDFITHAPDLIGQKTGLDPNGLPVRTAVAVLTSSRAQTAGNLTETAIDKLATILSASIGVSPGDPTTDDAIALNAVVVNALGKDVPPDDVDWTVDGIEYSKKGPFSVGQLPPGAHFVMAQANYRSSQPSAYAGTYFSVRQKNVPDGAFSAALAGGGDVDEGQSVSFAASFSNAPAGAQIVYEWYADGAKQDAGGNAMTYNPVGVGRHWVSVTAVDSNSGARSATLGDTFNVRPASVDQAATATAQAAAFQTAAAQQTALAQSNADATATVVERQYQAAAATATAEALAAARSAATATARAQAAANATATALARAQITVVPTFAPIVVDTLTHPGNVAAVSTKVALQRGRLYRFTFSGRVNLINPTRSVTANQLPEHVNGVTVPASGIVVIEGTGGVATISCGSGEPDPQDPGGYGITVEDLGPK